MDLKLFYVLVFLVLFSFAQSVCERNCTNCVILTEASSNSSFVPFSNSNLTVVIELRGNPTTGYGWYYSESIKNNSSSIIKALNLNDKKSTDEFYLDNINRLASGVGGTYCFKFLLEKFEPVKLNFEYYQPWNKNSSTVNSKTFSFNFSKAVIVTDFTNVTVSVNSNVNQNSSNLNGP
jgi:predicted secreted protein